MTTADILDEIEASVLGIVDSVLFPDGKPMLNLGCGKIHLPCERPGHHGLVDAAVYEYPLWLNVDSTSDVGADEVVNVFRYPWPWADNSFSGALMAHIIEHIPHEICLKYVRYDKPDLGALPDGFYAFFAELWRVLEPDAVAHIMWPSPWSRGGIMDPSHTRMVMPETFDYLQPDEKAPFSKNFGSHFKLVENPATSYQTMQ